MKPAIQLTKRSSVAAMALAPAVQQTLSKYTSSYPGSAKFFAHIGKAFAEAMLDLQKAR